MRTVTVPGYLRKEFFGQNSPLLCATGKQFRHFRRAQLVAAALAGFDARAFGENRNPKAVFFARQTLLHQLRSGFDAGFAVDADGFGHFQPPAEKGDFEQLFFRHIHLQREDFLQRQRFPAALVLGADNRRLGGDVFAPFDAVVEPDNVFQRPQQQSRPRAADFVRPLRHQHRRQHEGKHHNRAHTQNQPVNQVS